MSLCMKLTVVHGAGKGKIVWSGSEIIVVIALDRKKHMQYVLLEAQDWRRLYSVYVNPFNASCSKLLLFEGFIVILV